MKDPWSKFFWSDWEADQGLRLCSLAAQGLWMRMLCVCARHEPKGYLAINGNPLVVEDIARLAGVAETEAGILMEELDRNGVFSRNRSGCIYSRRMLRDEKRSKEGRKWKKQGLAQATETAGEKSGPSRGPAREPSPHILEARYQKDNIGAPAAGSAPKSAKAKGHSLPDDWKPGEKHLTAAARLGRDASWVQRQSEAMRNWALANAHQPNTRKSDWDRTFLNWMNTSHERQRPSSPNAGTVARPDAGAVDWGMFVSRYRSSQLWPTSLGPQPGYAGCRAPADVLHAHGFGEADDRQAGGAP
ncbi:hypothetical protein V5F32_08295 [Xanthobacter oligotrophicus]|uniref:Phage replisome organiser N-terminal domain-containing protein n=1 Tax=Xanthobacter oligotrophicus TaxID=2607286 RepID=A0ABW6ZWM1_9HYPH